MLALARRRRFPGVLAGLIAAAFGATDGVRAYANRPERDDSLRTISAGSGLLAVALDPTGRAVAAGAWDGTVSV